MKLPESLHVSPIDDNANSKQLHVAEVQKDSHCEVGFLPASLYILRSALP